MNNEYIETLTCECGKVFQSSLALFGHFRHCKVHLGNRYDETKHNNAYTISYESRAWSKGHKKNDGSRAGDSLQLCSDAIKGSPPTFKSRKHTEEYKMKMSEYARNRAMNHLNGWKAGSSKIPNKYEIIAEQFLMSNDIPYLREVTIPQSSLGKKGSYYQLDFLINDKIDLEIDGSSHKANVDSIRDNYVSKKYQVYRVKHEDSVDILRDELDKFLQYYHSLSN